MTLKQHNGSSFEPVPARVYNGTNWVGKPLYQYDGSEWIDVYLDDGLVGYWPLESSSAEDKSGNGNDGTLSGGVTTGVSGRVGSAFSFDGSDDQVDVSGKGIGDTGVTIAAWIKFDNLTSDYEVVFWGDGAPQFEIYYDTSENGLSWVYYDGSNYGLFNGSAWADSNFSAGNWNHVAGTFKTDGSWEFFANGTSQNTTTEDVTVGFNGTSSFIGAHPSVDRYFAGDIDEVRWYDQALSASEIDQLYQHGRVV